MNELILLVLNAINTMLALAPTDTAGIATAKRDVLDYLERHDVEPSLVASIHDTLNRVGAATPAVDQAAVDTVAAIEPQVLTPEERTAKTIDQAHNKGIPPANTREYLKSIQTAPEVEGAARKGKEGEEEDDSLVDEKGERKHKKDKDHKKEDHDKDKNQHKEHKGKLPPLQPDDSGLEEPAPQPK